MAKKSAIENNRKKMRLILKFQKKRTALKEAITNRSTPLDVRFEAALRLAELPRNTSRVRYRNRCELTGRPRGVYRKYKMSRIAVREMALRGLIPGLFKASW